MANAAASLGVTELRSDARLAEDELKVRSEMLHDVGCAERSARASRVTKAEPRTWGISDLVDGHRVKITV